MLDDSLEILDDTPEMFTDYLNDYYSGQLH